MNMYCNFGQYVLDFSSDRSCCWCAVERRRRDKINNWIVALSKIIPDCSIDGTKTGAVSCMMLFPLNEDLTSVLICYLQQMLWNCISLLNAWRFSFLQSKGGILSKACDYIGELKQHNQRLQESLRAVERVQMDNELLRQQVWSF